MNYLEQNLTALSQKQPELADKIRQTSLPPQYQIQQARSGQPTLKVDKLSLHSAYDPGAEAQKMAANTQIGENDIILLQGFGLGYLAENLALENRTLIAAEADINLLRAALQCRDLTTLLNKNILLFNDNPQNIQSFLRSHGISGPLNVVKHNPSIKLNPHFYTQLENALADTGRQPQGRVGDYPQIQREPLNVPSGLRILLPSPLYGGSLPIAGYCKRALQDLGHKVEYFDSSFYYSAFKSIASVTSNEDHQNQLRSLYTMFVSELVLAKAYEYKPDLIFATAQSPFTTTTLEQYKQLKIPVAFWFMEDFHLFAYWKTFAPLYDYFFVIQRGEFTDQLNAMGLKNHYYLPLAADPEIHKPLQLSPEEETEYSSELSFVGAGYHNRTQFFLQLLNEDFKIWGNDWNLNSPLATVMPRKGERISPEECVKIFNAAKININLHSSSYHNGVNPHGDFVNPRTFEIAACAAFQMVDPRSELTSLFQIGEEIVTFNDIDDLRRKKKYYLEHPQEMEAITQAARQRVLAEHTYKHRMQEMLQIITAAEPKFQKQQPNPNIAANLLIAAEGDEELKGLFRQFDPDEVLNIDKVAKHIRKGKGELTQTEGVFLLMKEFLEWAREKKVI